ncbi:hypothetical protein FKP32DRAFT_55144 [Trametes sanguinea]|nr:hypothetical protein FKP32DRAFT_55144 [Trametes sanguinea]
MLPSSYLFSSYNYTHQPRPTTDLRLRLRRSTLGRTSHNIGRQAGHASFSPVHLRRDCAHHSVWRDVHLNLTGPSSSSLPGCLPPRRVAPTSSLVHLVTTPSNSHRAEFPSFGRLLPASRFRAFEPSPGQHSEVRMREAPPDGNSPPACFAPGSPSIRLLCTPSRGPHWPYVESYDGVRTIRTDELLFVDCRPVRRARVPDKEIEDA